MDSEQLDKLRSGGVLPLLPLRDIVVFPYMVIPLFVGRERSVRAIEEAMAKDKAIILSTQKKAKTNDPTMDDIYRVGTIAEILQILKLADGTIKVLVEGLFRSEIMAYKDNPNHFEAQFQSIEQEDVVDQETEALMRSLHGLFGQYVKLNPRIPPETVNTVGNIMEPGRYADTISAHLFLKTTDKQNLLELVNSSTRTKELHRMIQSEIEILKIEKRVRGRVKKQMEKSQREYYLTEQMKAIQKELGKADEMKSEVGELEEKIRKAKMPAEVQDKALKELKKLELMPPMSAEGTVVRNYIEWLVDVPWSKRSRDKLDIIEVEKILHEDHYGLEKIKERILEYLSVRKLVKKMKGPILCFVGPPGVGKTSLGKSIARSLGRKFVRMSLGGVRDEAEIRGHRRTYIGALPGRIIQSMKRVGTKNPVMMLDEVDKMSMDFRGDPSAALLEVLDPEQNHMFNDHYLEVDFDLSEVLFITTANVLYTIPQALQDRMEVIRIPGYTEFEKQKIAEKFLIPKTLKEHGLGEKIVKFQNSALHGIIRNYTRESGVRNLERELAAICRKVARKVLEKGKKSVITVGSRALIGYLGREKFRYGIREKKNEIGHCTGLAWTEFGGEILSTEVTVLEGRGKLILTGKLGDVMQESAQAAMSYIRSRTDRFGLKKNFYQKVDIHVHLPEGAIPKDGPSAGITMATAIISALTRIAVRNDIAMTGEITLRGKVLPIGGLKEKIIAAHRGGIKTVLIPKENDRDLYDIPKNVLRGLKIEQVENMDQVIHLALTKKLPRDKKKVTEKKTKPTRIAKRRPATGGRAPVPLN